MKSRGVQKINESEQRDAIESFIIHSKYLGDSLKTIAKGVTENFSMDMTNASVKKHWDTALNGATLANIFKEVKEEREIEKAIPTDESVKAGIDESEVKKLLQSGKHGEVIEEAIALYTLAMQRNASDVAALVGTADRNLAATLKILYELKSKATQQ